MRSAKRIIGIAAVMSLIILIGVIASDIKPRSYSEALKMSNRVLSRNKDEMTLIAEDALNSELKAYNYYSEKYKDYAYWMFKDRQYVRFDIDAQGMLGGQYWSLIYCPGGEFCGERETYYYKQTDGGNNIHKAERIDEHWWFLWVDYDGTELSDN